MPTDVLAVSRRGAGPRLVLVHGFTQTGCSWDPFAVRLAEHHDVIALDAPGHGGSGDVRVDLAVGADLLGRAGGRARYVGYSMGGRLCLHLAVARQDLVERLVLVSTTAGIDDAGERAARRMADDQLAAAIERDGVDVFLDRWVAQPMFSTLIDPGLEDRRRNTAGGLASSLRLAGAGTQAPLWESLPAVSMPVLLVAGALDAKFVAAAQRMSELLPRATLAIIEGAGHAAHLEQPDAFLDVLEPWLAGR